MKSSLFTEIQCPVGSSPEKRLKEFLEQAELADHLGFTTFWIAEIHCQPKFSLLAAPYVVLGAVAQRTKRLRLGVAVNTLPIHHPVQLAEESAMLDILSAVAWISPPAAVIRTVALTNASAQTTKLTHDLMAGGSGNHSSGMV